jgi:hypothetical protein
MEIDEGEMERELGRWWEAAEFGSDERQARTTNAPRLDNNNVGTSTTYFPSN